MASIFGNLALVRGAHLRGQREAEEARRKRALADEQAAAAREERDLLGVMRNLELRDRGVRKGPVPVPAAVDRRAAMNAAASDDFGLGSPGGGPPGDFLTNMHADRQRAESAQANADRYEDLGGGYHLDRDATPEARKGKANALARLARRGQLRKAGVPEHLVDLALEDDDLARDLVSPKPRAPVMGSPEWLKAREAEEGIRARHRAPTTGEPPEQRRAASRADQIRRRAEELYDGSRRAGPNGEPPKAIDYTDALRQAREERDQFERSTGVAPAAQGGAGNGARGDIDLGAKSTAEKAIARILAAKDQRAMYAAALASPSLNEATKAAIRARFGDRPTGDYRSGGTRY